MNNEPRSMAEAAKAYGLSYRTLARWAEEGMIRTEGREGTRGAPLVWGRKQNRETGALAMLRPLLSFQELRKAATFLRGEGNNPFSRGPRSFGMVDGPHGKGKLVAVISKNEMVEIVTKASAQRLFPLPTFVDFRVTNEK